MSENVFACMEYSKQSYHDIMLMPVNKMYEYLKWKEKLEDAKLKEIGDIKNG